MIPLKDTIRSRHFPVITWVILGVNTIIFLIQLSLGSNALDWVISTFALVPSRWATAPLWFMISLITSMFLHGGWYHFLSNMWILFIFGDNVEDRMGPWGYAGFYLLSGVAAGLLHTFVQPFSVIPTLGASGAIAGVLGAYLLLFPNARVVTLVPLVFIFTTINVPAVVYLGFWFISQLFSGLTSLGVAMTGVAWWAHIGGFLFGLVMARFFLWRKDPVRELDSYSRVVDNLPRGGTWH